MTESSDHSFAPSGDSLRNLFIDFNAYFASVEQHDEPALRGRPVIVTPLASEHSGAIAASYEAKALGINRGTSVKDARRLCPDIAVRPARHDRYVELHERLMQVIEGQLPIRRIHSIDECVCHLDRSETSIAAAQAKARSVKRAITEQVGPAMRCSIGLAASPMLAKLACALQKPDGLVALPLSCLPGALIPLPLRAVPGIGEGVERRLLAAGIHDFEGLWGLQPKQARKIWGSVEGERFLYSLHGYDLPLVQQPGAKRMIGHSRVLGGADRQPARARIVARALLLKAASRLRYYDLHAGALNLSLRLYPADALGRDIRLRATQNSWRLLQVLEEHWEELIGQVLRDRPARSLKLVSVYLHELTPDPPLRDLFLPETVDEEDARAAALWRSVDDLNRRYGQAKVGLASQQGLDLNYLGVKIAFSRIPERAEFAC